MTKGKTDKPTVAVIGYGSQGRAFALNLHDSGYAVTVGLRTRSKSRRLAREEGVESIASIREAVSQADVVCMAFPDHLHRRVYDRDIAPFLNEGASLLFLHGLSVHFGMIEPPEMCDTLLLAPHAPGVAVRDKYVSGERTLSAFYAVHNDATGSARKRLLDFAAALGFARKRLVKTTFEIEAVGDLFGEQAVLCGGLAVLIKNGFDVLVEKGVPAENAYLEVGYQLDLIVSLVKQHGISGMFERISVAAQYGSMETGPELIDESVRDRMAAVYDRIASGEFPARLEKLESADLARIKKGLRALASPQLEKAARKYSSKG